MADEICHEYRASCSRKAAYFLIRLCASCYTGRQIYLAFSIGLLHGKAEVWMDSVRRCFHGKEKLYTENEKAFVGCL